MAYLLRALILLMVASIALTVALAMGYTITDFSHIQIAIPAFLYTIFAQAFVMFYFIGVSRLVTNVYELLHKKENLGELFEDEAPEDLEPYLKKVKRFYHEATLAKRQTTPWTILMLILGMFAFFLGGAHDTGLVEKTTHSGVVLGFAAAMLIGFFRQWYYLGKVHKLLRKIKALFSLPDGAM